jgi:hypothetical protein
MDLKVGYVSNFYKEKNLMLKISNTILSDKWKGKESIIITITIEKLKIFNNTLNY